MQNILGASLIAVRTTGDHKLVTWLEFLRSGTTSWSRDLWVFNLITGDLSYTLLATVAPSG